jgi:thymidylate synthase
MSRQTDYGKGDDHRSLSRSFWNNYDRIDFHVNRGEQQYIDLVKDVLSYGEDSDDRTGVGTRSLFAPTTLHFDLSKDKCPVMTTRRTFFRGAVEELLWMLRGDTNAKNLQDKNIHIWDGNTTQEFIEKRGLRGVVPENDIGSLYGFQMRNWGGSLYEHYHGNKSGIDQLQRVVDLLKKDPTSRRAVISFYNVSQIETGVLEPCHLMYIFYVNQKTNKLYCHLTIRSWDLMCGAPINIIWTALFTKIVAQLVGLEAGGIAITGANCHVYKNHIPDVKKQVEREIYECPKVFIDREIKTIQDVENLTFEDFRLENYSHHGAIKYEMAI